MHAAIARARSSSSTHLAKLAELVALPSVSTDPERRPAVAACARWLVTELEAAGLQAEVWETPGCPSVFAHRPGPAGSPTVLVYGHYDVQPASREDGWEDDPFRLVPRDGRLYARGVTDDKGPVLAILRAIGAMTETGGLPLGVKLLIEGEEEIGSPNLAPLVRDRRDRLRADSVLISDSYWLTPSAPCLVYGLRGLIYFLLRLTGPAMDLHSGLHGGVVASPHNALVRALATLWDAQGRVAVEGFWDGVREPSAEERADFERLPLDLEAYRRELGVPALPARERGELLVRRWTLATLDLHGVAGGYTGRGAKTVLPAFAEAKLSCRIVPGQDPDRLAEAFRRHFARVLPGAHLEVHSKAPAVLLDRASPHLAAAGRALQSAFGLSPVLVREGATIPAVSLLASELGVPIVLLPIGLPDDGAHSPKEKFEESHYLRGIEAFIHYFHEIAGLR